MCSSVPNDFVYHLICPSTFSELAADLKGNPSTESKTHHYKHYSIVKDAGYRKVKRMRGSWDGGREDGSKKVFGNYTSDTSNK